VFEFREGEGTGYDEIMETRRQFGPGSDEERAVLARLAQEQARQAGAAADFTDPEV
jgi:hypothetical protein